MDSQEDQLCDAMLMKPLMMEISVLQKKGLQGI
jgi:hypothetical protein